MRARLLVVITIALCACGLPIAQAMPVDADGPSGFSDYADFDDLIVSFTSPAAAVTPVLVVVATASFIVMDAGRLPRPTPVPAVGRPSIESRAPPLV